MTEQKDSSQEEFQDGFDLLDYPCEFQFKAMVKVAGLSEKSTAISAMSEIVAKVLPSSEVLDSHSKLSRTGKFESVSLTVELQSRQQLEAVYAGLAADSNVVMTL